MSRARNNGRKKSSKRVVKAVDPAAKLSVVTVRISDEEKERFDCIMKNLEITRYSDMMRLALRMAKGQRQTTELR